MNPSRIFIERPVATTLLTVAVALAGAIAFVVLPVSPLPQVDFPTISVASSLPGGSPDIMASSIATPLERQFGHIAGVTEMTSSSTLSTTSITLQFDLSRDINGAARDVEAGINAARTYLPANLPANPTYRKVNPADSPIMVLGLQSDIYDVPELYDEASTVMEQRISQISGVGEVLVVLSVLDEVISVTPAMCPNCRSSGVAIEDAMMSGLPPGNDAATVMVGKSTCGKGDTGSTTNAIAPASATAAVSSVVATGRSMKMREGFMRDSARFE